MPCALFCLLLAILSPAHAWQATSGENCELSHETDSGRILVHFSPAARQYAIAITAVRRWAPGPVFAIRFDGPRGLTITTRRHALLGNGETVSVTDRGFGNVLNGLEFNDTATARLGDRSVTFALDGAAQAVREFRSCATDPRA